MTRTVPTGEPIDTSQWPDFAKSAASFLCAIFSCHVDPQANVITGPTDEEWKDIWAAGLGGPVGGLECTAVSVGTRVAGIRIAGTRGLEHSFDRHAAQWFGRLVPKEIYLPQWQALIERAAQSKEVFSWTTGGAKTVAHLARIDGKYFVVQFFAEGERAGELATAFVPSQSQLTAMLGMLGH